MVAAGIGGVDGRENPAQIGAGPEGSAVVVQIINGLVDRGGDASRAAARFHTAGGPESLAAEPASVRTSRRLTSGSAIPSRTAAWPARSLLSWPPTVYLVTAGSAGAVVLRGRVFTQPGAA